MIITFKSKFALFRHSEVLRLRRELKRKEKEWQQREAEMLAKLDAERAGYDQCVDEMLASQAEEVAALRMGFNAHEHSLREEMATERQKLVDYIAMNKHGRPVYAEPPPPKEPDYSGQYVPPGHPSRRPPVQVAPALAPEEMSQLNQFKPQEANG